MVNWERNDFGNRGSTQSKSGSEVGVEGEKGVADGRMSPGGGT